MAQNEVVPSQDPGALIESVITKGDLARLSPQERTQYYIRTCESLGLNPFTKPFEYITLNGQLRLYARREAADQLRKINGISVEVVSRKVEDDLIVVHVRASDKMDRKDEDFGAVSIAGLKGESKANAILKAITKAKRRVTLSIAGLGFLDETEVEDIPARDKAPTPISAAADLDRFAEVPDPDQRVEEEGYPGSLVPPRHEPAVTEEDPFGLPPLPIRNEKPSPRRSAIWQEENYRVTTTALLDGTPDWEKWAGDIEFLVTEASSEELRKLLIDNKELLNELRRTRGDRYRDITIATATRRDELHAKEPDQ
jgi:hypothetical protein